MVLPDFLPQIRIPTEHLGPLTTHTIATTAAIASLAGAVIGAATMAMIRDLLDRRTIRASMARWPRDWPKLSEIFAKSANQAGYLALKGRDAMGSGALRLGWLYPRGWLIRTLYEITPAHLYPLKNFRAWILRKFAREVWVPSDKRLQHLSILGATGKGKSTKYAIPQIAYGASEDNSSYLSIDVKSPQQVRMFARLYRNAGKPVVFFDPWCIDESLGFEPLWRADVEVQRLLAEVIATYSKSGKEVSASGNSEFFDMQASKTLEAIIMLSQYWPRRFCNLPCIQQIVFAGGTAVQLAFKNAMRMLPPYEELKAAIERVTPLTEAELRDPDRAQDITDALQVLDRSGHRIAMLLKKRRKMGADDAKGLEAFWAAVRQECDRRKEALHLLVQSVGEFIEMPDDTRNSVVSTLSNKVSWFRDQNLARAFSRDEMDVNVITDKPSLLLVGAPMAKLETGSLFVASIIANLAITAIFQRGMLIEKNVKGVSKHPVYSILDEFVQLNLRSAPKAAATFRGFKGGLVFIYQDRGQIKEQFGENYTNLEANCVHKVLLQGAHEDTCEYYAKAIGEVPIIQKSSSGAAGEKKSVSTSVQRVPLVSASDVKNMRLNGHRIPDMALSIGAETDAFPLIPVPYYEDPVLRKLLGLKKTLNKKGPFWKWEEFWNPVIDPEDRYIHRRIRPRGEEEDRYAQYLEYVLGKRREQVTRNGKSVSEAVYEELQVPIIDLKEVGAVAEAKRPAASAGGIGFGGGAVPAGDPSSFLGGTSPGAARPGAAKAETTPKAAPVATVPVYGADFKNIAIEDISDPKPVEDVPERAGSVRERITEKESA